MYDETYSRMMGQFNKIPDLSKTDECDLIRQWQKHKTKRTSDKIVTAHLKYIGAYVWRFRVFGIPLEDLICEGTLGVMYALDKFDPDKGVRFVTYAKWWLRCYLNRYVDRHRTIATTVRDDPVTKHAWKFIRARARARLKYGEDRETILSVISTEYGCPTEQVRKVLAWADNRDTSLNAPLKDGDGETFNTLMDVMVSPDQGPESTYADHEARYEMKTMVEDAMSELTDRQRVVITRRYLGNDGEGMSFEAIASGWDGTKQRAKQAEIAGLRKMKQRLQLVRGMIPM